MYSEHTKDRARAVALREHHQRSASRQMGGHHMMCAGHTEREREPGPQRALPDVRASHDIREGASQNTGEHQTRGAGHQRCGHRAQGAGHRSSEYLARGASHNSDEHHLKGAGHVRSRH